jgi:hypothetical protein
MDSLAVELIDAIIGHVDEKDDISHSHLLSCSLVCRLWVPSSQRRLFHHVKLRRLWFVFKLHQDIRELDQVLLNSPHLSSYIRVLELPKLRVTELSTHYSFPGWIGIDQLLSPLLPKLTQVQKLKISGLSWNSLPGDFRQTLCRVLELPSMACVCIHDAGFSGLDDFTNFITHTRGLLCLSLTEVYVPPHFFKGEIQQREDNKENFERHPQSHLTFLDMSGSDWDSLLFQWILGPRSHFGVSHIHTLHVTVPFINNGSVNRLLCAIGSSLKHLSIILPHRGE